MVELICIVLVFLLPLCVAMLCERYPHAEEVDDGGA